ncbi:ATP-grasp domain-containing protein [Longimicrobium sp.]|uniref:carboxylate--amine ligase n=1 Tax=Longimicrobium sp. TaxID=2029185 RepID=UPI002B6AB67E|nr:ATP-grasp domain-containing protein [Longimicrobium sp.]HSU13288.1 ATP-grasp domain-containing protein [Longimicrobium sp.]
MLVTDGEQRAALAIVRSLGAAGHRVFVCSARGRSLAGASRHSSGQARVPDPLRDPAAFVDAIADLAARWGIGTLLPVSEAALLALLPERDRFAGIRIPFPPAETFRRICDKAEVAAAAARLGIAVPEQRVARSADDVAEAARELRFPLVLKPARSVAEAEGGRVKTSVVHVDGPAALDAAARSVLPGAYPLLLQERIVGDGVGVFLLLRGGETVAAFAHRRIREKPPSGGVSVFRESAALPADLLERSRALLAEFAWEGVAMVEYKRDAATGTPYLMEINGRFWGSLQLAVDAGVDFPALLVADAERAPSAYRVGARSRWEWGEVDHLIARFRRTPRELALPPGAPGRARALLDILRDAAAPRSRAEIFRLSDPRPFLRETMDWLARR